MWLLPFIAVCMSASYFIIIRDDFFLKKKSLYNKATSTQMIISLVVQRLSRSIYAKIVFD